MPFPELRPSRMPHVRGWFWSNVRDLAVLLAVMAALYGLGLLIH
jgi:hypothetical protein